MDTLARRLHTRVMYRLLAVVCLLSGCGGGEVDAPRTPVGLLLPFTGAQGGFGSNAELAVLLALEQVNQIESPKPMAAVTRDEFSNYDRGLASAGNLLATPDLLGLIGPQDPTLVWLMVPQIAQLSIVQMLPGIAAPPLVGDTAQKLWFRLAPSPRLLGCALGQRAYDDGSRKLAVIVGEDPYSLAFSASLQNAFEQLSTVRPLQYVYGSTSDLNLLNSVHENAPDAIVLVLPAADAARLIQESAAVFGNARWYFGPELANESFIENTIPTLVEGHVGISLSLPPSSADFAQAFAGRWKDEQALPNSYFFFDAAAVLSLAIASSTHAGNGTPTRTGLGAHVERVANPPGEEITWKTLARGIELARAGQDINYQGVSGPVDFDGEGNVAAGAGVIRFWTVENRQIKPELFGSCIF
jgi:ABC-type branched-subunit amino acid transport system substrate-binding protein